MENAIYAYNRAYYQYVTGYPQRYEAALPDLGNLPASCLWNIGYVREKD